MSGPYIIQADYNQFERIGHPGRYTSALRHSSGQTDFTGSNYGYGAVLVHTTGTATASLSAGGDIPMGALPVNEIVEISVSKIVGSCDVYVLKRQQ